MKEDTNKLGLVSMIGTYSLVTLIAWQFDGFQVVINDLSLFISGNYHLIKSDKSAFFLIIPIIFAVLAIKTPCSLLAAIPQKLFLGKIGRHALTRGDNKEGNHFYRFFITVTLEELFADGFFWEF